MKIELRRWGRAYVAGMVLENAEEAGRALAAELRAAAGNAVLVSGAGLSTRSGIRDYRGAGGRWRQHDIHRVGHITTVHERPELYWAHAREQIEEIRAAAPNAGHQAAAWLEQAGLLRAVITQNVDGLHHAAGSRDVLEMHGRADRLKCSVCSHPAAADTPPGADGVPRCSVCGFDAPLRPTVVLFGEDLRLRDVEVAYELAERAALMIVAGSTMTVPPVAGLPELTLRAGRPGRLAVLCAEAIRWDADAQLVCRGDCTLVLAAAARELAAS